MLVSLTSVVLENVLVHPSVCVVDVSRCIRHVGTPY